MLKKFSDSQHRFEHAYLVFGPSYPKKVLLASKKVRETKSHFNIGRVWIPDRHTYWNKKEGFVSRSVTPHAWLFPKGPFTWYQFDALALKPLDIDVNVSYQCFCQKTQGSKVNWVVIQREKTWCRTQESFSKLLLISG